VSSIVGRLLCTVERLIVEQAPERQADSTVLHPAPRPCDLAHGVKLGDGQIGGFFQDLGGNRFGRAPITVGFASGDQLLTERFVPARLLLIMIMLIPYRGCGGISMRDQRRRAHAQLIPRLHHIRLILIGIALGCDKRLIRMWDQRRVDDHDERALRRRDALDPAMGLELAQQARDVSGRL
jgi:hypothetical protein